MSIDSIQTTLETDLSLQIPESPSDPLTRFVCDFFTEQSWCSLLEQDRELPYRIVQTCFHFSPHALIRWGQAGSVPFTPLHNTTLLTDCQLTARAIHTLFAQKEERMDKDLLAESFIHSFENYPGITFQDLCYPQVIPLLQTPEKRGEPLDLNLYTPKYQELSAPFLTQIEENINELQKTLPGTRESLFSSAIEKCRYDFNKPILTRLEHELFKKTLYPKVILIYILDPDGSPFHVFAIEILPAELEFPQQYRIYQSFLDFYTLSDHLERCDRLLEQEQMRSFFTSFQTTFDVENREKRAVARELERCFGIKTSYIPSLLHFYPEIGHLSGLSISFTINTLQNPIENAIEFLQEQVHSATLSSLIAERILELNTCSDNRSPTNYFRVLFDLYRLLKKFEEEEDPLHTDLAHQLEEIYQGSLPFPATLHRIENPTTESFASSRDRFAPTLPKDITFEEIYSYANKHYECIHKLRNCKKDL